MGTLVARMYYLQRRDCPSRWRIFSRYDLAFGSGAEEDRAGFAPAGAADAGVALFRACPIALGPPWLILTRGEQDHPSCRLPPWVPWTRRSQSRTSRAIPIRSTSA